MDPQLTLRSLPMTGPQVNELKNLKQLKSNLETLYQRTTLRHGHATLLEALAE